MYGILGESRSRGGLGERLLQYLSGREWRVRCDVLVFKQQTDVEAAIEALHQRFGQMVEKDAERK